MELQTEAAAVTVETRPAREAGEQHGGSTSHVDRCVLYKPETTPLRKENFKACEADAAENATTLSSHKKRSRPTAIVLVCGDFLTSLRPPDTRGVIDLGEALSVGHAALMRAAVKWLAANSVFLSS
ncbi:unnamed protein product [Pleuronectes platessa]|uniref:Uncharacterized protein n=1 Tax=Pleuronectes platessa TaxID=8262 RepID=A0A9N7UB01_PLEPL|nr:unnamed protein product [Pleuronectes platessa]